MVKEKTETISDQDIQGLKWYYGPYLGQSNSTKWNDKSREELASTVKKDRLAMKQAGINDPHIERLIDWRLQDPRYKTYSQQKENTMNRQFTLELRVDYADSDKNAAMRKAIAQAGRHILATARLLSDGQTPQMAIFSDDFFAGHEEIDLLEDVIAEGKMEHAGKFEEESISPEMAEALRDMEKSKK